MMKYLLLCLFFLVCFSPLVTVAQEQNADLSVSITPPSILAPGDTVTYQFVIRNNGNLSSQQGRRLIVSPLAPFTLSALVSLPPGCALIATGTVQCDLPALVPGQSTTRLVHFKVSNSPGSQACVEGRLIADSADLIAGNDKAQDCRTIETPVDLSIRMSASPTSAPLIPTTIIFTVTVTVEQGTSQAPTVNIDLGDAVTSGTATGGGWTCRLDTRRNRTTCKRSDSLSIPAVHSFPNITITAQVQRCVKPFNNLASISQSDAVNSNNQFRLEIPMKCEP